jgi:hypothetical protein
MDNALSRILAKAVGKVLEVLESINLNVLSSLKRVVGMADGAVRVHATAQAVANILQKCEEIGIVRDGAVLTNLESGVSVESCAFINEMFGTLKKIIEIGASGLQKIVRMELPELHKLVDFKDNHF